MSVKGESGDTGCVSYFQVVRKQETLTLVIPLMKCFLSVSSVEAALLFMESGVVATGDKLLLSTNLDLVNVTQPGKVALG